MQTFIGAKLLSSKLAQPAIKPFEIYGDLLTAAENAGFQVLSSCSWRPRLLVLACSLSTYLRIMTAMGADATVTVSAAESHRNVGDRIAQLTSRRMKRSSGSRVLPVRLRR